MERAQLSQLEQARIERGWTQAYVAEQIEVDSATVGRWERGLHKPQPRQQRLLCKLFDKSPQFFGFSPSLFVENTEEIAQLSLEGGQTLRGATSPEVADAYTEFLAHNLTRRLEQLVWMWPIQHVNARYHELPTLLIQELEQKDNTMEEHSISRRDVLRNLASLPIDYCGLSLIGPVLIRPVEEILVQCAAGITACWYLRKGKDLAYADTIVSRYLPTLQEIARIGTAMQRKDAAELLVQCYLLKSILAWNVTTTADAASYAQQAVHYSEAAGNTVLHITSLRTQAAVFCYSNRWDQALQVGEQARYLLETSRTISILPLLSSYIYAGVATYQAYKGHKDDAFLSLRKAHAMFFAPPSDGALPIWIDHSIGNLLDNDGLTHYHLGFYKQSIDSFSQIDAYHSQDSTIPASCRVAALIERTMAEVLRDDQPRDLERCIDLWTQGIQGAKALQSNRCFDDSIKAFTAMRAVWPKEQRVKELREHIVHW